MEDAPQPTVHPVADDAELSALVAELTAPERARDSVGWHVVVQVSEAESRVFARLVDPEQFGDGSQRWLHRARRGASPSGWTEAHHPRGQQDLAAWRDSRAEALDRQLIKLSKHAWKCDAEAPYAVEFAPLQLV